MTEVKKTTKKSIIENPDDVSESDKEEKPVELGLISICLWAGDDDYPEGADYVRFESLDKIYEYIREIIIDKWKYDKKICGCGREFKSVEDGLKHFKKQESIYFNPMYYYIARDGSCCDSGSGHDQYDESEPEEEESEEEASEEE